MTKAGPAWNTGWLRSDTRARWVGCSPQRIDTLMSITTADISHLRRLLVTFTDRTDWTVTYCPQRGLHASCGDFRLSWQSEPVEAAERWPEEIRKRLEEPRKSMRAIFMSWVLWGVDQLRWFCDRCEGSLKSRWEARSREIPGENNGYVTVLACRRCGGQMIKGHMCRACGAPWEAEERRVG